MPHRDKRWLRGSIAISVLLAAATSNVRADQRALPDGGGSDAGGAPGSEADPASRRHLGAPPAIRSPAPGSEDGTEGGLPSARPSGHHSHFYARLELGATSLTAFEPQGFGYHAALFLGGAPAKGFVIGGGGSLSVATTSDYRAGLALIWPVFIDVHFLRDGGTHVLAGLGFGFRSEVHGERDETERPEGVLAGTVGVGFDVWVRPRFGIGVIAQGTYAPNDSGADFAPALLLTAVYH